MFSTYREALKERSRERVPLGWARSLGNEGDALLLLAELSQLTTAFETMRDDGHAWDASYYERQLPKARALAARLRRR